MITGNTTITLTLILSLVTVACTLFNTFRGRSKDEQSDIEHKIQEAKTRTKEMTTINVKLDNISADLRRMREDNADMKNEVKDIQIKLSVLEASIRSAHKRMDNAGIGKVD